jgi:hypothetical protein
MKLPLVHRKRENECTHQGFNWNSDEYTKLQLWLCVWRAKVCLRIRRREEFSRAFHWYFSLAPVARDGFVKLGGDLWHNFDTDLFKYQGAIYRFKELPERLKLLLSRKQPVTYTRLKQQESN